LTACARYGIREEGRGGDGTLSRTKKLTLKENRTLASPAGFVD
jgi:hypothetical protein